MKICLTVWLLSVAVGCSVNNSATLTAPRNENTVALNQNSNVSDKSPPAHDENSKTEVVNNGNSKTLDCNNPNGYGLVVVTDPERASQNSGSTPKILNVVVGDEIRAAIKVPTDSDAMGFSLKATEKTKEGFKVTIEYGSRYYYKKQFYFICKEGGFYLHRVIVESFDKNDPESMNNWDRKEVKIKPNLPIEKFSIFDYLSN